MIGEGGGNFLLAAYRAGQPRAAYVHPRVEMAGVMMNELELNGADLSDMQGYSTRWSMPPDHGVHKVPGAIT